MNIVWIILIVVTLIIFWLVATYNILIKLRQRTKEAFADIEVQLKRRHNLIPNLVNTVKGYAKHEKGLFESVTRARSAAMSAQGTLEQAQAENMLSQTLKSLFAVAENYPKLAASTNFLQLQDELSDTENKIQAARRFYNGQVRDFNTKQETFPTNLIAGWFSFKKSDYFEIELETERAVPEVDFGK